MRAYGFYIYKGYVYNNFVCAGKNFFFQKKSKKIIYFSRLCTYNNFVRKKFFFSKKIKEKLIIFQGYVHIITLYVLKEKKKSKKNQFFKKNSMRVVYIYIKVMYIITLYVRKKIFFFKKNQRKLIIFQGYVH